MDQEKEMEIEALKAIYMTEFQEIVPLQSFEITLIPNSGGDSNNVGIKLCIEYTPSYPADIPIIKLENLPFSRIPQSELEKLQSNTIEQARANVGTAMVFTLSSALTEWLNENNSRFAPQAEKPAAFATTTLSTSESSLQPTIDLTPARREGTPVTKETFAAWKTRFESEMREKGMAGSTIVVNPLANERERREREKRLTGRQLFERDATLVMSDVALQETDLIEEDVSETGKAEAAEAAPANNT